MELLECVRLEPHIGSGRSQAVATRHLSAGSLILTCEALSTVLLPVEKGQRCDTCHRNTPQLQKCSGCAAYFYCGAACQTLQWKSHHKKICKRFNKHTSSLNFQALAPHEKLDALLLSHLIAQLDGADGVLSDITSLLAGPVEAPLPPIVYSSPRISGSLVRDIYSRFGNNNFVIHSHLTTFGHGIFPLASRLFNHSCLPNAAAKYTLSPSNPPKMEVVALRDICPGEEICLPYLDPALIQSRQQIFQLSYGFECRCNSCIFFEKVGPIPDPPNDAAQRDDLAHKFVQFTKAIDPPYDGLTLTTSSTPFPTGLLPVFHESFITYVAETFRNASHDGSYAEAFQSGQTLLALYRLIYPPNYPQIGIHLLELAKTYWNSIASNDMDESVRRQSWAFLIEAKAILQILGPEGDEDGPLVEIDTLEALLREA